MSNVKYLYVRNPFKRRDITIASDLVQENDEYTLKFAWTFRRNDEEFIKKLGREVAYDRLTGVAEDSEEYSASLKINNPTFYGISRAIVQYISEHENTPKKYLEDLYEDMYYYNFCLSEKVRGR